MYEQENCTSSNGAGRLLLLLLLSLLLLLLLLLWWWLMGTLVEWRVDHQLKAFLGRGELWDVVAGVSTADVLLHGTVSFFLDSKNMLEIVIDG